MHRQVLLWLSLLWAGLRGNLAARINPRDALPLHLQDELRPEITLRAAVLHSNPFAIVEPDEETGELKARGLQIDLLERLKELAKEDGVKLRFNLDPWRYSEELTYNTAVDLVASDCEDRLQRLPSDSNITKKYDCNTFDLIIADLFSTSERFQRVDMTPPWLSNAISAMKFVGSGGDEAQDDDELSKEKSEITTLSEAAAAGATVCVRKGTRSSQVVIDKFQSEGAYFLQCYTDAECYQHLRYGRCVLYSRDELVLINKGNEDPSFEITKERFNTQYFVWPMRYDLDPSVSYLLKRWVQQAIEETTLDELYHRYFKKKVCPIGTAGENCELPCDPEHGFSDIKTGRCICESTRWTGEDCSIEVEEDLHLVPKSLKYVSFLLFAINAAAIAFCAIWLYKYRMSDQVRASQPFFLLLVLLGCLISSSAIIVLSKEREDDGHDLAACMAVPWLYSLGFCLTFGSLFAKIRRVHQVFKQASVRNSSGTNQTASSNFSDTSQKDAVAVSFQETLLIIGLVTLLDAILLLAWTMVDPLHWERVVVLADKFGSPLESQGFCTSDHWVIFGSLIGVHHLILLTTGCILCYKARKIPTMFQEGKYVSLAMLANLQLLALGVPILIVGSDPQTSFFVRSVIVWMNSLSVICLIFGNLMIKTHFQPSDDIAAMVVKDKINKAVGQYAQSPHREQSKSTESPMLGSACKCTKSPIDEDGDEEDEEDEDDIEDIEAPIMDIQKTNNQWPHNLLGPVSSIPMESYRYKPRPLPVKRRPRNIISSISMDSTMDPDVSQSDCEGLPTLPEGGAASRHSSGSRRSVTFGMAFISEGNDDGSEMAVPLGLAESDEEDKDEARQRARTRNSMARFSTDSVQAAAPPKPPSRKRASISSVALTNDEMKGIQSNGDDGGLADNDSNHTRNSKENYGPPQRPLRRGSWESDDDGSGLPSTTQNHGALQTPEHNLPPQRPVRVASVVDFATDTKEPLDPTATTATSILTPSTVHLPPNHRPPQLPCRLVFVEELPTLNAEINDEKNSRELEAPPLQPHRRASIGVEALICKLDDEESSLELEAPPRQPLRQASTSKVDGCGCDEKMCEQSKCYHIQHMSEQTSDSPCGTAA